MLQHMISIGIEFLLSFSYIKFFLCLIIKKIYVMIIKKGEWLLNHVEI